MSTRCLHIAVENISDEEEEEEKEDEGPLPELPTLHDTFAAATTHHHPPIPLSLPARSMSSPTPPEAGTDRGATALPMEGRDKAEGTSARDQRRKWTSVTSSSFDFSGDEGGTPASAAFGKKNRTMPSMHAKGYLPSENGCGGVILLVWSMLMKD